MKITVLGAGAGGTAVAFDCAAHGHEVRLFDFDQFPDRGTLGESCCGRIYRSDSIPDWQGQLWYLQASAQF